MLTLAIFRGLPGTGKTTAAQSLGLTFEADQYMVNHRGEYQYDKSKVGAAHNKTVRMVASAMEQEYPLVCLTGTLTRGWEVEPYLDLCDKWGYCPIIFKMTRCFGSVHDMPDATIQCMSDRWEDIVGEISVTNPKQVPAILKGAVY